jgi:putative endonuclease
VTEKSGKIKNKKKVAGLILPANWFVYLAECADGSIYTGISNNVEARILAHNAGKGAKYTKSRRPVILKAFWQYDNKSEATKAEIAFKQKSTIQKISMISTFIAGTNNPF